MVGRPQQLLHERTDLAWIWRDAVTVLAARQLAEQLMPCLGQRWAHVQRVAAAAIGLAPILGEQALTATAASWVHDVGYSTQIATTGFHALDGARYLAAHSWPDTLLSLVAYHTGAEWEAQQRDLSDQLTAIPRPPQHLIDAVTTVDLTTGPDGSPITLAARLADILRRYPPHDPVHRAISMSSTYLTQCQARVTARVQAAASPAKVGQSRRDPPASMNNRRSRTTLPDGKHPLITQRVT